MTYFPRPTDSYVSRADGSFEPVTKRPTLEEAQKIVASGLSGRHLIQFAPIGGPAQVVVNEEGLLYDLPLNEHMSALAGMPLVGDGLVLRGKFRMT
jgi:hypothetical protein